jgi:hypothetical protein
MDKVQGLRLDDTEKKEAGHKSGKNAEPLKPKQFRFQHDF